MVDAYGDSSLCTVRRDRQRRSAIPIYTAADAPAVARRRRQIDVTHNMTWVMNLRYTLRGKRVSSRMVCSRRRTAQRPLTISQTCWL